MPAIFIILLWLTFIGSWVNNVIDFVDCDFQPDYKCEAVHAVGIFVPPTAIVTAWFESDGEK